LLAAELAEIGFVARGQRHLRDDDDLFVDAAAAAVDPARRHGPYWQ
jgi:hypothetical protein